MAWAPGGFAVTMGRPPLFGWRETAAIDRIFEILV